MSDSPSRSIWTFLSGYSTENIMNNPQLVNNINYEGNRSLPNNYTLSTRLTRSGLYFNIYDISKTNRSQIAHLSCHNDPNQIGSLSHIHDQLNNVSGDVEFMYHRGRIFIGCELYDRRTALIDLTLFASQYALNELAKQGALRSFRGGSGFEITITVKNIPTNNLLLNLILTTFVIKKKIMFNCLEKYFRITDLNSQTMSFDNIFNFSDIYSFEYGLKNNVIESLSGIKEYCDIFENKLKDKLTSVTERIEIDLEYFDILINQNSNTQDNQTTAINIEQSEKHLSVKGGANKYTDFQNTVNFEDIYQFMIESISP